MVAITPARAAWGAALVAHVLGWVLPVVDEYRGWQAFRVAFSPIWPYEQFRIDAGPLLVLSVASALTNVLFVVLAVWLWRRGAPQPALWAAAAATLLNLHWPISMGAQRVMLENGYFVWVCSFVLLALCAFLEVKARRRSARR